MISTKRTAGIEGDNRMHTNRPAATKEDPNVNAEGGKMTNSWKTFRVLIATIALAALALVLPAALPVHAAGLSNCVDLVGRRAGACYELVWADGDQLRMTFANQGEQFAGTPPSDQQHNFYVMAPQTGTPQGVFPSFPHDHVVGDVPSQNHGDYSIFLHGFVVLCSAEGITGGGCVPTITAIPGLGIVPLATTVNGKLLTSVEPIESPANAGLLTLLDTGAVFVATINP
jgi:hypothetical protein